MEQSLYRFPIKVLTIFLIVTEILYFVGPIKYPNGNLLLLIFYFFILNSALYLGFLRGIAKSKTSYCKVSASLVHILLIVGLFLNIYYLKVLWATHGLSFSFSNLLFALVNPGSAYKGESLETVNVNIITGFLLTPFRWACIPIGICRWKKLNSFYKSILLLTVCIYIVSWLGIGTRKGLMDLILIIFFLSIAANPLIQEDPKSRRKLFVLSIAVIALFLFFFLYSNLSRAGLSNSSELSDLLKQEYRSFYVKRCSPELLSSLSEITIYLCQGYEALSIALAEIGILPITFGGFSMQTWLYLDRFFGYNPIPGTYMYALETRYGIDMYENWHSIYLWLANDFTFIGVPIVVFLIGYYFARVWKDSIHGNNPWSFPVLAYMIIMVFYFFANNQVLSFSLESFLGCVLIYEFSRTLRYLHI